jgi:DDE superfamily endonuclease
VRRWLIPAEANAEFVFAMETLLAVSARPIDPRFPLVCFDESGKDLKAATRPARPPQPGRTAREDAEDDRQGSANLFLAYAPYQGWRQITVTERRTALDFAQQVRTLLNVHFPAAERLTLVLDNLNTHTPAALFRAFPAEEAWRLLQRLEWVKTPRHGSWLNMAEREWSVLARQCLDRRIPDRASLQAAIDAWVAERNAAAGAAVWRFTQSDARRRLHWLYPCPASDNITVSLH